MEKCRMDSAIDDERSFVKGSSLGVGKEIIYPERDHASAPCLEKRVPENPWMLSVRGQGGNNPVENDHDPIANGFRKNLIEILGLEIVKTTRRSSSMTRRSVSSESSKSQEESSEINRVSHAAFKFGPIAAAARPIAGRRGRRIIRIRMRDRE